VTFRRACCHQPLVVALKDTQTLSHTSAVRSANRWAAALRRPDSVPQPDRLRGPPSRAVMPNRPSRRTDRPLLLRYHAGGDNNRHQDCVRGRPSSRSGDDPARPAPSAIFRGRAVLVGGAAAAHACLRGHAIPLARARARRLGGSSSPCRERSAESRRHAGRTYRCPACATAVSTGRSASACRDERSA
jgi:hypothetical protein